MSSTALTIIEQPDVTQSLEAMRRHLSIKQMDAPRAVEVYCDDARLHLAAMHLAFSAILVWHGLKAMPSGINAWAGKHLSRVPRTHLFTLSASSFIGWGAAVYLTVLLIWR